MENPGFQPDFIVAKVEQPDKSSRNSISNPEFYTPQQSETISVANNENIKATSTGTTNNSETVHMKRQIGLLGGISLIVGTMIGSGIFITPQRLLEKTDSVAISLTVWAGCGVLAILAALSYCELGTVVPRSGGEHAYYQATFGPLHKFFGELPGFLFAWMTVLLLKPSSLSIISLTFGQYALYPLLSNATDATFCMDFQDGDDYQLAKKLLAVFIALLIAGVNIISAQMATRVAIVFMGAKLSAMALMIGIGIYNVSKGEWGALTGKWDNGDASVGDVAVSFYSGLWAYDGWNNLNFAMEELANPYRTLPLAIIIGISLVTGLYVLINVSYLTALSKVEMIASSAVAIDVGNQYLGVMKWVVPVMVTLSAAGTGNGSMFSAGRISYVAGRDGHMVDVMSYIHATRLTPVIAILVNTLLGILFIFASEVNELIDLFSFASWFIYGLAISCVIVLRFTQPNVNRPFRVPIIIPIIAVLVSAFLVVVPLVSDPKLEYIYVLVFCAIGIVVYYIFVYKKWRLPYMDEFTKFIQAITLAAPSPYKED